MCLAPGHGRYETRAKSRQVDGVVGRVWGYTGIVMSIGLMHLADEYAAELDKHLAIAGPSWLVLS